MSLRAVKSPLAPKIMMEHGSRVSVLTAGLASEAFELFMCDTMPQVPGKFNGADAVRMPGGLADGFYR
jgi:hypothetical protein